METPLSDLPDADLIALAQRQGKGCAAEGVIVMRYEQLVCRIVSRNLHVWRECRDDAMQTGRIAILRAARRWNEARGVTFITYAYQCVTHAVVRGLESQEVIRRSRSAIKNGVPPVPVCSVDVFCDAGDGTDSACDGRLASRDERLDAAPFRMDLERAIAALTNARERKALTLFLGGAGVTEIAAQLRMTKKEAIDLVERARARVALVLESEQ